MRQAIISAICCSLFSLAIVTAQPLPENAQVNLYLPAVLDGGPASQKWVTSFTFTNPNSAPATIGLFLNAPDGTPLNVDLGSGPNSSYTVKVPPLGTRLYTTKGTPATTAGGWAVSFANVPVQASVTLRQLQNGSQKSEATLEAILPSILFTCAARA